MISTRLKLIYLHAPKTAGNSIQEVLLPAFDDKKLCGDFRDGVERYELKGPITPEKHATLSDYAEKIDIADYQVAMACREPFRRAISAYFSPSTWHRKEEDQWVLDSPTWDVSAFLEFIKTFKPAVSFLAPRTKPDFLLRFESLQADLHAMQDALGMPRAQLAIRNRSAAAEDVLVAALGSKEARQAVQDLFFCDYEAFNYMKAGDEC